MIENEHRNLWRKKNDLEECGESKQNKWKKKWWRNIDKESKAF